MKKSTNNNWNNDRFECIKRLADSLQGYIYLAADLHDNRRKVVVKEAFKRLVEQGKSQTNIQVSEDIRTEIKILTFLSKQSDRDNGFCYIIDNWETKKAFYFATEFCEAELYLFISKAFSTYGIMYNYMKKASNLPQILCDTKHSHEWLHKIRDIFGQIVTFVHWMHSKNVVHFDLSLENTMIYNLNKLLCWGFCRIYSEQHIPSVIVDLCINFANLRNTIAEFRETKVKIIDFGVAKHFSNGQFIHRGRVGKIAYMAPEVYSNCIMDARGADIWSLGVILFILLIGAPPYTKPSKKDMSFNFIIKGKLNVILLHWKRLNLISKDALDCMNKIFKWEKDRITMEELLCHPFVDLEYLLNEHKQVSPKIEVKIKIESKSVAIIDGLIETFCGN
eukprot:411347_1